jgi:light-regulated signal transduction histidine kinase (bacteriophytochrome)
VILSQARANLQTALHESAAVVRQEPLPLVQGDETQLVQLFQNLLANALTFRQEAAPLVHVEARPQGTDWLFAVRDNGIGIDPQYHERIFAIFERLHNLFAKRRWRQHPSPPIPQGSWTFQPTFRQ